jgi:dihydrodipicolinate synthase/N-acetylneuraminate lyase
MTALERQMYLALMGARTIIAATANVNPKAAPILRLVDGATKAFKDQEQKEPQEETEDAAGD